MYPVYIKNYGLFKLSFNKFNNYFLSSHLPQSRILVLKLLVILINALLTWSQWFKLYLILPFFVSFIIVLLKYYLTKQLLRKPLEQANNHNFKH